jgi:hypothetical protein
MIENTHLKLNFDGMPIVTVYLLKMFYARKKNNPPGPAGKA